MTVRKVWLGSTGPFLYDDSVLYIDEDGVISPDNQQAIATDGQIVIQSPPSSPVHAVRKQDLDDAVGDISALEARIAALESTVSLHSTQIVDIYTRLGATENVANYARNKFSNGLSNISFGGWTSILTAYCPWSRIDNISTMQLPALDGTSTNGVILMGNVPAELFDQAYQMMYPLLVFTDAGGWEWAACYFDNSTYGPPWNIVVVPYTKSGAFPTSGRKFVPQQQLIWIQQSE